MAEQPGQHAVPNWNPEYLQWKLQPLSSEELQAREDECLEAFTDGRLAVFVAGYMSNGGNLLSSDRPDLTSGMRLSRRGIGETAIITDKMVRGWEILGGNIPIGDLKEIGEQIFTLSFIDRSVFDGMRGRDRYMFTTTMDVQSSKWPDKIRCFVVHSNAPDVCSYDRRGSYMSFVIPMHFVGRVNEYLEDPNAKGDLRGNRYQYILEALNSDPGFLFRVIQRAFPELMHPDEHGKDRHLDFQEGARIIVDIPELRVMGKVVDLRLS